VSQPVPGSRYLFGAPFSSWGRRAGAYLIDALFLLLLWGLPTAVSWVVIYGVIADDGTAETVSSVTLWGFALLVMLLYYPLTLGRAGAHNGQTWGKQLVKIRVVRQSGEPVGRGFALLREMLVKNVLMGFCGLVQLIDFLWPIWDDYRQCVHDKILDTFVVQA
jgi:uncharacterized RDD family membrane protein YckC